MNRSPIVAVVALAQAAWPCEEIAVLSHDAKYMLMDGDTLETVEVGNLRWQDVWGVDVVLPGSTAERLAFMSDSFSGKAANPTGDRSAQSALVVVGNLMEADDRAMDLSISRKYDFRFGDAWWIDGTDELLVWQKRRSLFTVLDKQLKRIDEWTVSNDISEPVMACRNGARLFVGARDHRIIRDREAGIVEPLEVPEGLEDCRLEPLSLGCRASMGCRRDGRYVKVFVDVASNDVVSMMPFDDSGLGGASDENGSGKRTFMISVALFAGGGKLLRQLEIWTPDPAGVNTYRSDPGALLRVWDTGSGALMTENNDAPPRTASRVFCRGGDERVVLSGRGRVHLVDLNTLEPIASAAIPFGRHFVF